jgi:plasmid stabilization system protein ParE
MGRIVRSPESDADIDEVTLFIARHSLDAALRVSLIAWTRSSSYLHGCRNWGPNVPNSAQTSVPCLGSYLIVYRPIRGGIELVRFLHGSRNLRRLFRRRPKK